MVASMNSVTGMESTAAARCRLQEFYHPIDHVNDRGRDYEGKPAVEKADGRDGVGFSLKLPARHRFRSIPIRRLRGFGMKS